MRTHPIPVHDNERTVKNVELTFLDEENRSTVLDRNRARWREGRHRGVGRSGSANEHQTTTVSLCGTESPGDAGKKCSRIPHCQHAVEVQRRVRHPRSGSPSPQAMLLVPFDLEIVDPNIKARSVPLSLEPQEPLLTDCRSTVCGALAAWSGTQGVHDDVMFGGTGMRWLTATNYGVGTQGKTQPVSGREYRNERLSVRRCGTGRAGSVVFAPRESRTYRAPSPATGSRDYDEAHRRTTTTRGDVPDVAARRCVRHQEEAVITSSRPHPVADWHGKGRVEPSLSRPHRCNPLESIRELPTLAAHDRVSPAFESSIGRRSWSVLIESDDELGRLAAARALQHVLLGITPLSSCKCIHERLSFDDHGIERQTERCRFAAQIDREPRTPQGDPDFFEIDATTPGAATVTR